jgi:hypothetical protein
MLATHFLFQDGADVVTYLTMDNHKSSNIMRIWHYFSNYPSNLDCPLGFLQKKITSGFFVSKLFKKSTQLFWQPGGHQI